MPLLFDHLYRSRGLGRDYSRAHRLNWRIRSLGQAPEREITIRVAVRNCYLMSQVTFRLNLILRCHSLNHRCR
jgi:hypothetical protein